MITVQQGGLPGQERAGAIDIGTLESIKRQWQLAADALPQLVCLVDRAGKVIRANRTLERWGLVPVAQVRGLTVHEALHGGQCDANCTLGAFWGRAQEALARGKEVKHQTWDERLARDLSIVIQPQQPQVGDVYAIALLEDVGPLQAHMRRLTAQHVNVREDERRRVARDLHDALGQSLNVLKLYIQETARRMEEEQPRNWAQSLEHLGHEVQLIMTEVRRIAMDLRPSTLDDLGLIPTLSWFFRELEAHCKGLAVERAIEVTDADVPEPLKIAIYRILQEAICNTVRHAGALAVRVALHRDAAGLHLRIEDNGRGFNGDARQGQGLRNMKERAESAGGRLIIESVPGKGTRLTASWPAAVVADAGPRESIAYPIAYPMDEPQPRRVRGNGNGAGDEDVSVRRKPPFKARPRASWTKKAALF